MASYIGLRRRASQKNKLGRRSRPENREESRADYADRLAGAGLAARRQRNRRVPARREIGGRQRALCHAAFGNRHGLGRGFFRGGLFPADADRSAILVVMKSTIVRAPASALWPMATATLPPVTQASGCRSQKPRTSETAAPASVIACVASMLASGASVLLPPGKQHANDAQPKCHPQQKEHDPLPRQLFRRL